MGGQDQSLGQAGFGLGPVEVVHLAKAAYIRDFIIIFAVLELFLAAELAVFDGVVPGLIPNGGGIVEGDEDAVEAVGDLDGDGVEALPADLLEIGELGDLLAVEPDLPTQAPGGDGELLPVILHQADVVLAGVDADGLEGFEIELDRVAGIGFEDDLELVVHLQAVGVLAVAAVVRADGGLDVGDFPGLGAEDAQEGGGVHGAGADLGVIRLPDEAALGGPEFLQFEDDGLEIRRHYWIYDLRFRIGRGWVIGNQVIRDQFSVDSGRKEGMVNGEIIP